MPRTNNKNRSVKGGGSIRERKVKRKDGSIRRFYEARVTVGYDPDTGRQIQKSISGDTQSEVRKKMSVLVCEVDGGTFQAPLRLTVADWLNTWLDTYVLGTVKPYTEHAYRSQCECHIKPELGGIKLTDLSPVRVQQFYNKLHRTEGLSPKTVKNIHGILHKALGQAVKVGYLKKNPTELCDLPKAVRKEIKPLEQEDVSKLIKALKGEKYELVILIDLFTGLRQGELLGLTWDCVDFENNTIYVNKQLIKTAKVGGEYTLAPTKTGQSRLNFVAPTVIELLKKQKAQQEHLKELAGKLWSNPWNLVFTNEIGCHLCHMTVFNHFKSIVRSIGLGDTRFHDLRHSFAVACLESGDDIKTVQENLGHSSAAFTMAVYAHASQKMRQRSAENMERYINEVSTS